MEELGEITGTQLLVLYFSRAYLRVVLNLVPASTLNLNQDTDANWKKKRNLF